MMIFVTTFSMMILKSDRLKNLRMELTVDLVEITRIPYHELETVYISANLAVVPNGTHVQTKISSGNKSVKFTPHRFPFLIDPISSNSESSLVITIFTHLTNNHKIAISYVSIPINSIPIRKICSASLSTTLLASFSISPIVTVSLGINVNSSQFKNVSHEQLHHPNEVSEIDYTLYEDAPIIEFDCFGRLKPPNHYIEKCKNLVENDQELFLNFILNDSLRKFVLKRAFDHYQVNNSLSISNISSGGQQQQQQQPPIANKQSSSKKTKSSQMKQSHSSNHNHQPQPPNQQPSNSRRQNRNDDVNSVPPIDTNLMYQQPQSFSPTTEINSDSQSVKSHNISVSILKKQYPQQNKNQSAQQYSYVPQQQQQQQQPNSQIYQNQQAPPISQLSQISHKNESPPKSFALPVGVDQKKNHRSKNLASIGISKPLIKTKENDTEKSVARSLLPNDKNAMSQPNKKSRPIYVVRMNPPNQNQNQEDARSHSYNDTDAQQIYGSNQSNFAPPEEVTRKASPSISYQSNGSIPSASNPSGLQTPTSHDHRSQFFPMMKPKPPNPNTVSQHPNGYENGASPRWPRQAPEY